MKKTKKPFFAKFLENQINKEKQEATKGGDKGGPKITKIGGDDPNDLPFTVKYPSDMDEEYMPW